MHIHTIINQVQDFIHILPVPSFQKIIQKLQINFTIGRRSENQKCIIKPLSKAFNLHTGSWTTKLVSKINSSLLGSFFDAFFKVARLRVFLQTGADFFRLK